MRQFHLSDVLSVVTGRLVSNRHIHGVTDILSYMTGYDIATHQIPRAMAQCGLALRAAFPLLDAALSDRSMALLIRAINHTPAKDKAQAIATWVQSFAHLYGEFLSIVPLVSTEDFSNPVADLQAMMHPESEMTIVVVKGDGDMQM